LEKILEIKLLNNVISETLRLHSPAAGLLPRVTLEDHILHYIKIQKGDLVDISLYGQSMNPLIFPNPYDFRPERWDSQNLEDPFQFKPFSAGPRNCFGQHLALIKVKTILAVFMQSFEFGLRENKVLKMKMGFTVGPEDDELVWGSPLM
jgi:cytochrome P450